MTFFDRIGPAGLGSRTRLLSEKLHADARQINLTYGSDLKTKWFPVFYLLHLDGSTSISGLAAAIGQSHPAVVRIINELVKEGFVVRSADPDDGRKSMINLTEKGQRAGEILRLETVPDVDLAIAEIAAECEHDLWAALREWEVALERRSLFQRTTKMRKIRAAREVLILPYQDHHQRPWHDINEEWISRYFVMEKKDYASLRDPRGEILNRGGHILIAEYREEVVGTCALIPLDHPDYAYELAKMGVSPRAQGLGIGYLLGKATLDLAGTLGAKGVYLETNDRLQPAIRLYEKLGFVKVKGLDSPYERANYKMAVNLTAK